MEMTDKNREEMKEKQRKRRLYGAIFLHGFNDMHSTSLPATIPLLAESISLTLSQAGILSALFGMASFLLQPIFGYFSDKQKRPWFAVFGPLVSVTGASLLPLSPNFGGALICIGIMGIGTSLFHPQGNGQCGASAERDRLAFFLSLFHASGTGLAAVGPLYVVFMVSVFGRKGFPLVAIPAALLLCIYLFHSFGENTDGGADAGKFPANTGEKGSFVHDLRSTLSRVGWIVAVTCIRDTVFQSIRVFLPTLYVQNGASVAAGSAVVLAVTLTAAAGGVAGGRLADSIGGKKVLFGSFTIAPFFLIFGLWGYGAGSIASLMAGYAFLQASVSVVIAMAQRRCSDARSFVSSLVSGATWGVANLCVTPVGILADCIGLQPTLKMVAFLPWCVTAWFVLKMFTAGGVREEA